MNYLLKAIEIENFTLRTCRIIVKTERNLFRTKDKIIEGAHFVRILYCIKQ